MGSAVLLDEILEPLSLCMDDQRVARLRLSPEIDARVEYLAERSNEGLLSPEERQQYETIVKAADMIFILKLKASARLLAQRAG